MTEKRPLRLGIVGTSTIALAHAKAIRRSRGLTLGGLTSRSTARAEEYGRCLGVAAFDSVEALCAQKEIDAVVVCTESHRHADPALTAIAHGKPVLVEKPLDIDPVRATRVAEASLEANVVVGVVSQRRFEPRLRALERAVRAGGLESIEEVRCDLSYPRSSEYYLHGNGWRVEHGGVLDNQAVHWLDVLQWLFGSLTPLRCSLQSTRPDVGCVDRLDLVMALPNEATCRLTCTTEPGREPAEILRIGRGNASMRYRSPRTWPVEAARRTLERARLAKSDLQRQLEDFAASILDERAPVVDAEQGRRVVDLIDACRACATSS